MKRFSMVSMAMLALLGFSLMGCDTKLVPKKADSHDHAHEHGHEEGKHGGHMLHLEPTGDHAEWTHDDEKGILSIYFEELVAGGAKVEKVRVELKLGKDEPKTYELTPAAADEHKIEGSIFSITSPELVTAMEVDGVKTSVVATVDGKELKASLEHDHGHDHGHKH